MKFLKQDGYSHNPMALFHTFKTSRPKRKALYCKFCGEPDCLHTCEPVSFWQVMGNVLAWLVIAAAVCVALNYAMDWRFGGEQQSKPVAASVRG